MKSKSHSSYTNFGQLDEQKIELLKKELELDEKSKIVNSFNLKSI